MLNIYLCYLISILSSMFVTSNISFCAATSNLRLFIFVFLKLKKSIPEQIYKTYHKKKSE